ncbi:hypothetical protein AAC387_Pa01g2708 [Persea americana]
MPDQNETENRQSLPSLIMLCPLPLPLPLPPSSSLSLPPSSSRPLPPSLVQSPSPSLARVPSAHYLSFPSPLPPALTVSPLVWSNVLGLVLVTQTGCKHE